jgi:macrolide-specific efflux system membrane fusion protein
MRGEALRMNKNLWLLIGSAVLLILVFAFFGLKARNSKNAEASFQVIQPHYGSIQITVSTTGTVEPQNRLEVKPPIAGRVEKILVVEGQWVRKGETLAWLSSTERAALLDAARTQGAQAIDYWEGVYKPTPIVSPITGTVIVRSVEPGQTVLGSDPIVVLSDRLIVKAQVDETDIGKLKLGQKAVLSLDAYPDIRVEAQVDHIAYESKVVSNVTIYQVDILPKRVPPVFRSGMSANVDVILQAKDNILLVPREAIQQGKHKTFVRLAPITPDAKPERRPVVTGLSNDQFTEIVSGIDPNTRLVIVPPEYALTKNKEVKQNPFLPRRGGGGRPPGGGH